MSKVLLLYDAFTVRSEQTKEHIAEIVIKEIIIELSYVIYAELKYKN